MMTFSQLTPPFVPVFFWAIFRRRLWRAGAGKLLLILLFLPLLPFVLPVAQAAPTVVFTSPANNAVITLLPATIALVAHKKGRFEMWRGNV
jgi:hypothetical protein